jgi:hypothetical protein
VTQLSNAGDTSLALMTAGFTEIEVTKDTEATEVGKTDGFRVVSLVCGVTLGDPGQISASKPTWEVGSSVKLALKPKGRTPKAADASKR